MHGYPHGGSVVFVVPRVGARKAGAMTATMTAADAVYAATIEGLEEASTWFAANPLPGVGEAAFHNTPGMFVVVVHNPHEWDLCIEWVRFAMAPPRVAAVKANDFARTCTRVIGPITVTITFSNVDIAAAR